MHIRDKLDLLRAVMETAGVDAYLIFGTDPHQSEYPAAYWKTREWISGFSGSAGTVVITRDQACLWVDFRYYLQAEQEVENSGYTLFKQGCPDVQEPLPWLKGTLKRGNVLGFCKAEVSLDQFRKFTAELGEKDIACTAVNDLLDGIWKDRPPLPCNEIYEIPLSYVGVSREDKLELIRRRMREHEARWHILSTLDDIAWVLNVRGRDIPYNPLALSHLFVGLEETCLCIDERKLPDSTCFDDSITVVPYEDAASYLAGILEHSPGRVLLDSRRTSMFLAEQIPESCPTTDEPNVTTLAKAKKHDRELAGMEAVHLQDGAALVSFLCWLDREGTSCGLTEVTAAEKLLEYRMQREGFIQESFKGIFGFRDHGAVVHYSAAESTAYTLEGRGLMIIDTGGQYWGGTTDVTRTIVFGEPTEEEIRNYTLVLKGHLQLAATPFPAGTRGIQLEALAKSFLWQERKNYGHGTGHGIGHMLCVHEGPASISARFIDVPIESGMIFSDEPGLYIPGAYGIRIENLIAAEPAGDGGFGDFLKWKVLTKCPYERNLINVSLLSASERRYVDGYHQGVLEELTPLLTEDQQEWLQEKTAPLLKQ